MEIFQVDPDEEQRQLERLDKLRKERDNKRVRQCLETLGEAATKKASDKRVNIMPATMDAVKAYTTVGEMYGVLREVFGEFKPSVKIS